MQRDVHVRREGDDTADGSLFQPWRSIEHALTQLVPGDRLVLGTGTWDGFEIAVSGDDGAWIGVTSVGPGSTLRGPVRLASGVHHVQLEGLDIGGFAGDDVSGVRIEGAAHHVIVRDSRMHDITGTSAMGITVYGTDGDGVRDLWIFGNLLEDLEPAPSEALVVNGNVQRFRIEGNRVEDVNNIGIDVIGGEDWLSTEHPIDGAVVANRVVRANSNYGDGAAAGVYVDGADHIAIERNWIEACDFGIEIGAENAGVTSQGILVRSNVTWRNFKGGLIFGGFARGRGRVADLWVGHNTFALDGRPDEQTRFGKRGAANGEVIAQWADRVTLVGNILHGSADSEALFTRWGEGEGFVLDGNLYWGGTVEPEDAGPWSSDPGFVDLQGGDLHLRSDAVGIDARLADEEVGPVDLDGQPRLQGPGVDLGAYERAP